MKLTLPVLRRVCPTVSSAKLAEYLPLINDTLAAFEINTRMRVAAWLANVVHESGEFKWMKELASGAAYEGRKDLGNTEPGDGIRFKGRGPIQITGRANYRAFTTWSKAQGHPHDFEDTPTLLEEPKWGFLAAGWFWDSRKLNEIADVADMRRITRRINGGLNGHADRMRYYRLILSLI